MSEIKTLNGRVVITDGPGRLGEKRTYNSVLSPGVKYMLVNIDWARYDTFQHQENQTNETIELLCVKLVADPGFPRRQGAV